MKHLLIFVMLVFPVATFATDDPYKEDREALLVILTEVKEALNTQDFTSALKYLDENGVVTYYNAEVTVGHEEAANYFEKMMNQSNGIVKEYDLQGDVTAPATFHGDTAVAHGTTSEKFVLAGGLEFDLAGHWSTTLHKKPNGWKIINLHFSANLFDNPLLGAAKRMQWIIGIVAFLSGVGILVLYRRFFVKSNA